MKVKKNKIAVVAAILMLMTTSLVLIASPVSAEQTFPWTTMYHDNNQIGYTDSPSPNTPHLLWKALFDGFFFGGPVVVNGRVYLASYGGDIRALNESTGEVIWLYHNLTADHFITYYNNKIYTSYATINGTVNGVAFDAITGQILWTFPHEGVGRSMAGPVANGKWYMPATNASGYSMLYILNAETGQVLKSFTFPFKAPTGATIPDNGTIYIYAGPPTGAPQRIFAVNETTGAIIWTIANDSFYLAHNNMAYKNGFLYFGTRTGNQFISVDAKAGKVFWNQTVGGLATGTAVAYNKVYGGAGDGYMYSFDVRTGAVAWRTYIGGSVGPGVAVSGDGKVFLGSQDHNVYALNALTGAVIWSYQTGDTVGCTPTIADGKVFIGSDDRYLYAFGPPPPSSLTINTPKTVNLGDTFTVNGKMTDSNGAAIANETVTLRYRNTIDIGPWTNFANVVTGGDGTYSLNYVLPNVGQYQISATFPGNDYGSTDAQTTMYVLPQTTNLTSLQDAINSLKDAIINLEKSNSNAQTSINNLISSLQLPNGSLPGFISNLESSSQASLASLQNSVSTMTIYLIAVVILLIVAIALGAIALLRPRQTRT